MRDEMIEKEWQEFRDRCLKPIEDPSLNKDVRRVYFAGAVTVLSKVYESLGKSDAAHFADTLTSLKREMEAFGRANAVNPPPPASPGTSKATWPAGRA